MRLATILATAAAIALSAGAAQAQQKIRIGTEGAYPPFNSTDSNGQLVGLDIDVAKALCEKMKAECTFVAQDWDGIIPALMANKYDAIVASMSITDERKQQVDFTIPYYLTPGSVIAPKDTKITDISPAGLKGKTIGAQSATTGATYLEDKYKDSDIKLYPTQDEANADLAAGRLDAVMADKFVLYEWIEKSDDGKKCCKFVGEDIADMNPDGTGIAIRKDDTALRDALNKAIKEIQADGTFAKINAKYFPFPID